MNAIDWTADKVLSVVKMLNADADRERRRIQANRDRYMATLHTLPRVKNGAAKDRLRAQLTSWIHNQVAAENRFNDFEAKFTSAKLAVKKFLQSIRVTPPGYLGALPLVPAAVVIALTVAIAAMAIIVSTNLRQSKSIDGLNALVQQAVAEGWSPEETQRAIDAYNRATQSAAPPGDPLGLSKLLDKAGPLVLGVAAIIIVPKLIESFRSRRTA